MGEDMVVARALFRTVGPTMTTGRSGGPVFAMCRRCTPPPELHVCPVCKAEFVDRWRYLLHVRLNPQWCQQEMRRTATAWARHV